MANRKNKSMARSPSCQEVWPACHGDFNSINSGRSRSRVVASLFVVEPARRLGANGIEQVSATGFHMLWSCVGAD